MRLVLIEWTDSYGAGARWQELSELKPAPMKVRSVGWLIYDTNEYVVIVPHMAAETERTLDQGCGEMTIPSHAIESIVDISHTEPDSQSSVHRSNEER